MLRAELAVIEYPFNRIEAAESMKSNIPGITDTEIDDWLKTSAQKIDTDNETIYFTYISSDYLFENFELLQDMDTIDFDYVSRYAIADEITNKAVRMLIPYATQRRKSWIFRGTFFPKTEP